MAQQGQMEQSEAALETAAEAAANGLGEVIEVNCVSSSSVSSLLGFVKGY